MGARAYLELFIIEIETSVGVLDIAYTQQRGRIKICTKSTNVLMTIFISFQSSSFFLVGGFLS